MLDMSAPAIRATAPTYIAFSDAAIQSGFVVSCQWLVAKAEEARKNPPDRRFPPNQPGPATSAGPANRRRYFNFVQVCDLQISPPATQPDSFIVVPLTDALPL